MGINSNNTLRNKQNGNVLIVFTVALFALIGMASLALDGGHLLLNKGKLQNLVDAAALHAATELDEGATHEQARAAVVALIQLNITHNDHHELASAIDFSSVNNSLDQMTAQLNVEFSQLPDPFIQDNNESAKYVKVSLSQLDLDNFLADVFSFNKQVSATALSGPSSDISNCYQDLVPMVVCADLANANADALTNEYGLKEYSLNLMKIGSNSNSPIGPGNFQLLRLGSNTGAADIRAAMAGDTNLGTVCFTPGISNQSVPTEPGNTVGPVAQGLNTRMGEWYGPVNSTEHLRDTNICEGATIELDSNGDALEAGAAAKSYTFNDYDNDEAQYLNDANTSCDAINPISGGNIIAELSAGSQVARSDRRILQVVIADCNGTTNGANDLDFLDIGCFFMTQKVGSSGPTSYVVGEFINSGGNCTDSGTPSITPVDNDGPYKIVLFHVPGSSDS
ncbi:Tad domain-containing protein [Moritella sp.]|uniref:Tad domain-containing protein n=1 Tax=Moritella sp. TaxID=78556 RepID=UPI001E000947|nr:Tad domain-containing protein [Moritella sp.]MCJ8349978.1 Tad domain-containing protein [Moritella sp.]NQZ39730.1 Tad domain-containing protein [Moritella sp.]